MLRHQSRTAYDIYLVRHLFAGTNIGQSNELAVSALSQRFQDQVEDTTPVGFDDMVIENGIFAVGIFSADLETQGALAVMPVVSVGFPKPFRVPYAAWILNPAVQITMNFGIEIFFERIRVTTMEQAELITQAGGRPQSPPS